MTLSQTIGLARTAGLLGVLWLAGLVRAEEPAPAPPGDKSTPVPVGKPAPPPDPVWDNVLEHHHAYVQELDRLSTQGHEPPGSGFGGFHFAADAGFDMVHSYFSHHPAYVVT